MMIASYFIREISDARVQIADQERRDVPCGEGLSAMWRRPSGHVAQTFRHVAQAFRPCGAGLQACVKRYSPQLRVALPRICARRRRKAKESTRMPRSLAGPRARCKCRHRVEPWIHARMQLLVGRRQRLPIRRQRAEAVDPEEQEKARPLAV